MIHRSNTSITAEEFLALSEDGISRELIRGELRNLPKTTPPAHHADAVDGIASALNLWLACENHRGGLVVSRVGGCRLTSRPDSIIGMDVAVFFGDAAWAAWELNLIFPNPPTLMVKVLAPKDTHGSIVEKIRLGLEANVPQIWIVDPDFHSITVHCPKAEIKFFNRTQSISGEPELRGLQIEMSSLFAAKRTHP